MSSILLPAARFFASRSKRQQQRSDLWNPANWGASSTPSGHLELDKVSLPEVLDNAGSPLLVVSRGRLHDDAKRFRKTVARHFDAANIAYSYKTNCIPGVLQEVHECGLGAEVISAYELSVAARLRLPGDPR